MAALVTSDTLMQICDMVNAGMQPAEIAPVIGVTPRTLKRYMADARYARVRDLMPLPIADRKKQLRRMQIDDNYDASLSRVGQIIGSKNEFAALQAAQTAAREYHAAGQAEQGLQVVLKGDFMAALGMAEPAEPAEFAEQPNDSAAFTGAVEP